MSRESSRSSVVDPDFDFEILSAPSGWLRSGKEPTLGLEIAKMHDYTKAFRNGLGYFAKLVPAPALRPMRPLDHNELKRLGAELSALMAPPSTISTLLRSAIDQTDARDLGKLSHDLVSQCADATARKAFDKWLSTEADGWVKARRPALAAVIEAAAMLGIPEALPILIAVLKDDEANTSTLSIAAQRIRLFNVPNEQDSAEIGGILARRIEGWLSSNSTNEVALRAIPSAVRYLIQTRLDWVVHHIAGADNKVSWATAQGILDIAGGQTLALEGTISDTLFDACFARIQPFLSETAAEEVPQPDLVATLLWALGAVCTEQNIERTATLIVQVFDRPRALRAAAAVKAGRLVIQHWREKGVGGLLRAFQHAHSESHARYLALALTTQPR